ncbi:MAG: Fur family transcriptional regulator [Bacillota bacterium]|nr:Fur family transcriptional regulator [Bacillota bacterium]MDW7683133.1 Fur family transcriptional regulator [Bacillota bacterium]
MSTPALLKRLKENGYKLTKQRRQMIEALRKAGCRASAREVHAFLRQRNPSVSLDTVYRNLRILTEIGVVHQISLQSGAVFELAEHHHHHLICVDCEKVVCIPYCPESQKYTAHASSEGFEVLGHNFEVYGRCSSCQHKNTPGS